MIQEALVILACTHNTGCSQTSGLYYSTHPEVKQLVTNSETVAKRYTNADIVAAAPILFLTVGGTATFKLSKHFSIQANKNMEIVSFRYEF